MPSALAVLRLITSSNLAPCWTGRSAVAPLKTLDPDTEACPQAREIPAASFVPSRPPGVIAAISRQPAPNIAQSRKNARKLRLFVNLGQLEGCPPGPPALPRALFRSD